MNLQVNQLSLHPDPGTFLEPSEAVAVVQRRFERPRIERDVAQCRSATRRGPINGEVGRAGPWVSQIGGQTPIRLRRRRRDQPCADGEEYHPSSPGHADSLRRRTTATPRMLPALLEQL